MFWGNMAFFGHFPTSMRPAGGTPAPPVSTRFPGHFPAMSARMAHRPFVTWQKGGDALRRTVD